MRTSRGRLLLALAGLALLTACGGASPASCPPPPVVPYQPPTWLVYPAPNATSVPVNIGQLIVANGGQGITVTSLSAPAVTVGAPTAAPSPVPTPTATPPPNVYGPIAYESLPISQLTPSQTYSVWFSELEWADNPPSCQAMVTQKLGSFTTQ